MKKGISLVSLMITVVIIVLLATTVTISATSSIDNSRKINFSNEISLIQEKVNNYYLSNNNLPILEKVNLDEAYLIDFVNDNDGVKELYKIDFTKLSKLERIYGNEENKLDFYAIDISTNKVYYVAGVRIKNIRYYSLTDELKTIIRYTDNSLNNDIIFNQNHNKWTNQNIITEILIPSKYTDVRVVVFNEGVNKNVSDYEVFEKYNKYTVNNIYGNYNIEVRYIKEGVEKSVTYEVNNFDNTKPSFMISDKKVFTNDKEKYYYIEISEVKDELSGIAKLKFLNHSASLDEIINKGINIQNNIMEFDENTEFLTLYIEDKAGNYVYDIIEVKEDSNEEK